MKTIKTALFILFAVIAVSVTSCKKDEPVPEIAFTQAEGTANDKGEYLITGTITSEVQLLKVVLTKEGTVSPNLTIAGISNTYTDDSTAKNKTVYEFAYQVAGVSANTTIIMEIHDQNGTVKTVRFLINAFPGV